MRRFEGAAGGRYRTTRPRCAAGEPRYRSSSPSSRWAAASTTTLPAGSLTELRQRRPKRRTRCRSSPDGRRRYSPAGLPDPDKEDRDRAGITDLHAAQGPQVAADKHRQRQPEPISTAASTAGAASAGLCIISVTDERAAISRQQGWLLRHHSRTRSRRIKENKPTLYFTWTPLLGQRRAPTRPGGCRRLTVPKDPTAD